jgi:hypothetical protein
VLPCRAPRSLAAARAQRELARLEFVLSATSPADPADGRIAA